jgi:Fe-S-cluster-containing hydrogenase component 2/coenzyme F420-reducing hydrogenase delta subunit
MIRIALHRCQRWRYNRAECSLCMKACPVEGCIRYENGALCIDNERCVGCGICTGICPSGALVMEHLDDSALWNKLQDNFEDNPGQDSLVLGCSLGSKYKIHHNMPYSSSTSVNLPCLAILKESHLVAMILSGIEIVYLDAGSCEKCSFSYGRNIIEKAISHAQNLLSTIGYYGRIKLLDSSSTNYGVGNAQPCKDKVKRTKEISPLRELSRRDFFLFLRGSALDSETKERLRSGPANESDPFPERRAVLLELLRSINGGIPDDSRIKEGNFPIHEVEIKENCALCRSCELFCPTGALKRIETDGEVRMDFQMALCMGCYQCKELCPEEAIYYNGQIGLKHLLSNEVKTIVRRAKKDCPECGRSYFPEIEGGCPTCRKRRALDKGIFAILTGAPEI